MTHNTQELDEALTQYWRAARLRKNTIPPEEYHSKAKQAILDWHNKQVKDPFDYIEPCEPDCSPERHAYHQGQWDMAHRMADLGLTTDKLKEVK